MNSKVNYNEVSLLIPIRIDSSARMANLEAVLEYYHSYGFKILLGEEDVRPHCDFLHYRFPHLEYHFFQSNQSYFYRTHVLNLLIAAAKTKYVANYDCDVFFPQSQIDQTIQYLNEGYEVVYPYDGRFYNMLRQDLKNVLSNKFDLQSCRGHVINPSSHGGAIFFERQAYIKGGGENENFVSWGSEDNERFYRFKTLGFKIKKVEGMCYHVDHPRGLNSRDGNPYFRQCEEEYKKIMGMDKLALEAYIRDSNFIKV